MLGNLVVQVFAFWPGKGVGVLATIDVKIVVRPTAMSAQSALALANK